MLILPGDLNLRKPPVEGLKTAKVGLLKGGQTPALSD